ncbi:MAG: DNA primase [Candidatus Sericytochromatia bacterium]|nr:DNA primase [Candidatus Tanganyikabacteria bacterium]
MDDKTRVRQAADILEVIGQATVLKHKGGPWYTGLCPFHQEKTPSFRVNASDGFFKCFGCGEKGDVFTFLMKRESLDFRGALKHLADRYGIELTEAAPEFIDEQRKLREAMAEAHRYFRRVYEQAEEGAAAREYAARRGLSPEVVERFGIGASPRGWDGLLRHLSGLGFAPELLENAGLIRRGQQGGFRDFFRGRLMFPICTDMGAVVAFGARALDPGDQPKYLNSPETPLYQKGQHVFALHLAKEAIRKADRVLVAEGYMDVIALHEAGFEEAVAVLGTAMTPQQARNLLRYTPGKRVIVAFDADAAGQTAASQGIATLEEVARATGLFLSVLAVPDGKDPDEFIRAHGAPAFAQLAATAPDVVAFQIARLFKQIPDLRSRAGQDRALRELLPVLRRLGSPARASSYYGEIALRLGLTENAVAMEFNPQLRHNGALQTGTRPVVVAQQRVAEAERGLIYLMVQDFEARRTVAASLGDIPFPTPAAQALRERLCGDLAAVAGWPGVIDRTPEGPEHDLLIDISFEESASKAPAGSQRVMDDYVAVIACEFWRDIASSRARELTRPDLSSEDVQRITLEIQDAKMRAQEHLTRLSGRSPGAPRGGESSLVSQAPGREGE